MIALHIIFWACIFFLLQTYVLYPLLLTLFSRGRNNKGNVFAVNEELPTISLLFAAYNEESVIERKLTSSLLTSYPQDKLEIIIGSDKSTDNTNEIVKRFEHDYANVRLVDFQERTGKVQIVNQLVEQARGDILVLTDANVFFQEDTLYELVKSFKDEKIQLVGGNIVNTELKKDGISKQETSYLNLEKEIKFYEGTNWGAMIGAFGGIYAIRKQAYAPVPQGLMVDDFYITMKVLEKGGRAIFEPKAICFEDVSNKIKEEFRRKSRISIGNFQNLGYFKRMLNPFTGVGFAFFSHKVLRWFGPFLLIFAMIASGGLALYSQFYQYVFFIQVGAMLIPLLDLGLRKLKIHFVGFRFISHFYLMNLALLIGFFKYLGGANKNVWTPTQRYQ